jgi:hypothetical protein
VLWSHAKNDSGSACVDAAVGLSVLSMEDIWKEEGRQ